MAEISTAEPKAGQGGSADPDPRQALLAAPMSAAQTVGVALTLLVAAADGFDILAASFAAPGLSAEWKVTHASIGLILAMNLVGLGLGAAFISPLADRIGRRLTILPCLLLIAASMLMCGLAHGPAMLAALRLVTGLGIGGMTAPTLSLATEHANLRNRPFAAAVVSIGLPLGGMIGGAMASWLLVGHGWRSIFVAGGMLTLGITAAAALWLPESVEFLLSRRDERGLRALNTVLRRFRQPVLTAFPARGLSADAHPGESTLRTPAFGESLRMTTLTMMVINFAQMATVFFFMSWLPQMIADMKFTGAAAAGVSVYQNLFGIFGALLVGLLARRLPIAPLAFVAIAGTAAAIMLFAILPRDMGVLKIAAGLEGFTALGSSASIYGVMAKAFPAASRSTGIGLGYAFGRLGSIVAAIVPGLLFTAGLSFLAVAALMAIGSLAAVVALAFWCAGPNGTTALTAPPKAS